MKERIILIGPCGAGKTTVGRILSNIMGFGFVDLDSIREAVYSETDYSCEEADRLYREQGVMGWYSYIKPYEFYSVKYVLSHYYNTVIAFGGGQSVYDGTEWEQPFIHLMRSEKNAFMLAPSLNETEALSVLDKRIEVDERILNRLFIQSRTSRAVSRRIITGSPNPNDTAAAILREIIISP